MLLCGRPQGLLQSCYWPPVLLGTLQATRFLSLPDDLTCVSMKERWIIPRERKIGNQEVQSVLVKKPWPGANCDRYIKNTLYSPARQHRVLDQSHYNSVEPKPLIATIAPGVNDPLQLVPTKFGHAVKGSVISYQQRLSEEYLINNYSCTSFPDLPFPNAELRFENYVSVSPARQAYFIGCVESLQASYHRSGGKNQGTKSE